MIKRFNVIKEIGRFQNLSSNRGNEGDFAQFNVLYAHNACGKSTICDILRSLTTGKPEYIVGRKRIGATQDSEVIIQLDNGGSPQTARLQSGAWNDLSSAPKIHIYDDRFVSENVFIGHYIDLGQRRNLYGLVIGAQAIALQQAVNTADQELKDATDALSRATTALNAHLPQSYTIDSFRRVEAIDDIDNKLTEAATELKKSKHRKAKAEAIRLRKPLSPISLKEIPSNFEAVLAMTLDDAALAAEEKIKEHLQQHANGLSINWVQQGYAAQKDSTCPHCGQDMSGMEILSYYKAYFSGEIQRQESQRNALKSSLDSALNFSVFAQIKEVLVSHENEKTWWKDAANHSFELPEFCSIGEIEVLIQNIHNSLSDAIARKQASPSRAVPLTDGEQTAISDWERLRQQISQYNESIAIINQAVDLVKTQAATVDLKPFEDNLSMLTASKKRQEQAVIDAFSNYDTALQRKNTAQSNKRNANDALRQQSDQLFERYGSKINEILSAFSVDFQIASDGVNFKGGQPSGQLAIELMGTRVDSRPESAADPSRSSLANTLSGGDRSALALAYFLACVELDAELANCIVVFDDPYHNQDRSRRQRTLEMVQGIASRAKQCFVLSHDLEFARAVTQRNGNHARTFVIQELATTITLEHKQLPMLPNRAYEKNYTRLSEYVHNPAAQSEHLKEVADTLRIILEEHLRLKFPLSWADNDWLGDMLAKIRDAEDGSPLQSCRGLLEELGHVNTYSCRFHHGARGEQADEPDPRELKGYAERTLRIIHNGGAL